MRDEARVSLRRPGSMASFPLLPPLLSTLLPLLLLLLLLLLPQAAVANLAQSAVLVPRAVITGRRPPIQTSLDLVVDRLAAGQGPPALPSASRHNASYYEGLQVLQVEYADFGVDFWAAGDELGDAVRATTAPGLVPAIFATRRVQDVIEAGLAADLEEMLAERGTLENIPPVMRASLANGEGRLAALPIGGDAVSLFCPARFMDGDSFVDAMDLIKTLRRAKAEGLAGLTAINNGHLITMLVLATYGFDYGRQLVDGELPMDDERMLAIAPILQILHDEELVVPSSNRQAALAAARGEGGCTLAAATVFMNILVPQPDTLLGPIPFPPVAADLVEHELSSTSILLTMSAQLIPERSMWRDNGFKVLEYILDTRDGLIERGPPYSEEEMGLIGNVLLYTNPDKMRATGEDLLGQMADHIERLHTYTEAVLPIGSGSPSAVGSSYVDIIDNSLFQQGVELDARQMLIDFEGMRQEKLLHRAQIPSVNVTPGTYEQQLDLCITTPTVDAVVHYTLDGSLPSVVSPVAVDCVVRLLEDGPVTVNVVAVHDLLRSSATVSFNYVLDLPKDDDDVEPSSNTGLIVLVVLVVILGIVAVVLLVVFLRNRIKIILERRAVQEEKVRRANEIIELNESLHQEIAERKELEEKLRQTAKLAEAANLSKTKFLANVAHETRTPIHQIILSNALLLESELDSEQDDLARMTESSANFLLALVNDILDYSRMETSSFHINPGPTLLHDIVEDAALLMSPEAQAKDLCIGVIIRDNVPDKVHADAVRLRQILTNLLSNAIKFSTIGGIVVIVSVVDDPIVDAKSKHVSQRILFEVRDTGIGVPASAKGALFQRFSQVDASYTRETGGVGLGLSICKQLVSLMGGGIGLRSVYLRGSVFWFSLPLPLMDETGSSLMLSNAGKPPKCLAPKKPSLGDGKFVIFICADSLVQARVHAENIARIDGDVELIALYTSVDPMASQPAYANFTPQSVRHVQKRRKEEKAHDPDASEMLISVSSGVGSDETIMAHSWPAEGHVVGDGGAEWVACKGEKLTRESVASALIPRLKRVAERQDSRILVLVDEKLTGSYLKSLPENVGVAVVEPKFSHAAASALSKARNGTSGSGSGSNDAASVKSSSVSKGAIIRHAQSSALTRKELDSLIKPVWIPAPLTYNTVENDLVGALRDLEVVVGTSQPSSDESSGKSAAASDVDVDVDEEDSTDDGVALSRLNVLMAEDNPINRKLLVRYLTKIDVTNVTTTMDGLQVLDTYRSSPAKFDVILMDVSMPVMDGVTSAKHIRDFEAKNGLSRTPILAVTANSFPSDRAEYLQAGMDDIVTKPIRDDALKLALTSVAEHVVAVPALQHASELSLTDGGSMFDSDEEESNHKSRNSACW